MFICCYEYLLDLTEMSLIRVKTELNILKYEGFGLFDSEKFIFCTL